MIIVDLLYCFGTFRRNATTCFTINLFRSIFVFLHQHNLRKRNSRKNPFCQMWQETFATCHRKSLTPVTWNFCHLSQETFAICHREIGRLSTYQSNPLSSQQKNTIMLRVPMLGNSYRVPCSFKLRLTTWVIHYWYFITVLISHETVTVFQKHNFKKHF